jgi:S-adenosylmethionine decarboxylase
MLNKFCWTGAEKPRRLFGMIQLGKHCLVDLHGCDRERLTATEPLKKAMLKIIADADGTIVNEVFHTFSPYGVTGVVVIAESHVAIHTWPEHNYAALDIFTCGEKMRISHIIEQVAAFLGAQARDINSLSRSTPLPSPYLLNNSAAALNL